MHKDEYTLSERTINKLREPQMLRRALVLVSFRVEHFYI